MVVPAPLSVFRLIFRGKEHRVPHEFAVVEHRTIPLAALVVPVHHGGLAAGVGGVVILVGADREGISSQLSLQLRVAVNEHIVALQLHMKHIPAVLDVGDAAFPEQVQKIHLPDGNVPHPPEGLRVPEHPVDPGAGFQLVVPHIGVDPLKAALLQLCREDCGEHFRLGPVPLLPGQDVGGGEAVHGVGVLGGDGVEEPAGGRLHGGGLPLAHGFPVAHPVPAFPLQDPPFQIRLALPVAVQGLQRYAHLFRPNGRLFFFLFCHIGPPFVESAPLPRRLWN